MTLSHKKPFAHRDYRSGKDTDFNDESRRTSSDGANGTRPRPSCPQDALDDLPAVFLPSQQRWQLRLPLALAGGAAIATSLGLIYAEGVHPQFEGRVQLQPHYTTGSSSSGLSTRPAEVSGQSAIATPEVLSTPIFSSSQQAQFLTTHILPRVAQQLQAQGIELSMEELSKHIQVSWHEVDGLEVTYHADNATVVNHVLRAIAQTYETQTGNCISRACQDARYIQAQIPPIEQELARLRTDLNMLRHQHQVVDLNRQHRELEATVHEFLRIQQAAEQELLTAQADLARQQAALGLSPDSTAAQELLKRSPDYAQLLSQWTVKDQQIVNSSLKQDAARPSPNTIPEYERLSQEIYGEIRWAMDGVRLYDLPSEMRHAIVDEPARLGAVPDWLEQTQRVQFLTLRQRHLAQAREQLGIRVQQWRSLLTQHRRLESQINTAMETLRDYRERYARLQQQPSPQQTAWRPVAPPEITPVETPLSRATQWLSQRFSETAHARGVGEQ